MHRSAHDRSPSIASSDFSSTSLLNRSLNVLSLRLLASAEGNGGGVLEKACSSSLPLSSYISSRLTTDGSWRRRFSLLTSRGVKGILRGSESCLRRCGEATSRRFGVLLQSCRRGVQRESRSGGFACGNSVCESSSR